MPPCRPPNHRFRLPATETVADVVKALDVVAQTVAGGHLSTQEGESLCRILESQRRTIEAAQFETRLRALEEGRQEEAGKGT